MKDVLTGSFVGRQWYLWPPDAIRIVDWNIERGLKLPGIVEFLAAQDADLLTLQEVDLNARRTGLRNVAEELARSLRMHYAFGWEFQELAEGTRDRPAYTGQATLSRWPIRGSRVIRFQAQSQFWLPKWYKPNIPLFQERLGGRIALLCEIDMPGRPLAVFNVHLESRGTDGLRVAQLTETLSAGARYPAPTAVLVAGDMNLDVARPVPAAAIRNAGFRDAVSLPGAITSVRLGPFNPGRSIDAILIRQGLENRAGHIHNRVRASDHYPVSCTVVLVPAT
jgi:endonuclease/exonuclease/phosphatase family metal-dependent hydrolase